LHGVVFDILCLDRRKIVMPLGYRFEPSVPVRTMGALPGCTAGRVWDGAERARLRSSS
jgi:hypothetical protein